MFKKQNYLFLSLFKKNQHSFNVYKKCRSLKIYTALRSKLIALKTLHLYSVNRTHIGSASPHPIILVYLLKPLMVMGA